MGKVDDLRRMREERWASMQKPNSSFQVSQRAAEIQRAADTGSELCGHQSISKKSCTRPAGHSEKNHRYT